ncbi:hypothetical protein EPI10_029217 [Gossypium australe]|uniref:Uncharacterized protein n=1 Tax=Gossypium australe TaxID=47621 RepID=A0A5B6V0U1_9ROSI|nr:hypothetical protein EPI10_029217 [Gossypium australe]
MSWKTLGNALSTNYHQVLTGSSNRFAVLETVNLVEDQITDRGETERSEHIEIGKIAHREAESIDLVDMGVSPKKPRAAIAGVADLVKSLKSKRNMQISKGKKGNKVVVAAYGSLPSSSKA